jgi:hypothetical protein
MGNFDIFWQRYADRNRATFIRSLLSGGGGANLINRIVPPLRAMERQDAMILPQHR